MTTTHFEITTTYVERVSGPHLIQIIQGQQCRFIIKADVGIPGVNDDFFVFDHRDNNRFFPYGGSERIFFRKEFSNKNTMIIAVAPAN